ncbi:DNA methylase [Butyrivibrio sp. INlla16]|uniref:Y-family DNA polymerase n=1 Tax=Butyrivibrio sp. INlla16 TaxID=1520807 RepID=UPI000891E2FB|nr:DNA methylase [Butyrivibrio sp. INlla16]SDB24213.1 DNA polymerase V [Butyrivibrio sp. INlla16]
MSQNEKQKAYIAIDLKSFYASVECHDIGRNPLTTNLVVADRSRTSKTICLAVSPALKKYGIPGRARLFEVEQKVKEINANRLMKAPGRTFTGESDDDNELSSNPSLKLDFIAAVPRMARYMEISTEIYKIYLKYISPEDIHVYSIDEVFIDATGYLGTYNRTPKELAMDMIKDVQEATGITATAGIGTNLYLAKVAMDIVAKHVEPDENGVRIAQLDEMSYREKLWNHTPLADFWRVGRGYVKKLSEVGLYTMGDIARCSLGKDMEFHNEELLYKLFGINAELLIDHAWGYEPCTMEMIKAYKPENNSLSQGQVLHCPYDFDKARIIVREMADALAMQLLEEKKVTDQIVLTIGYDMESLKIPGIAKKYKGKIKKDYYGREVPEHAHGSCNLDEFTALSGHIIDAALKIYDEKVAPELLIRRVTIVASHVIDEASSQKATEESYEQLSLFDIMNSQNADSRKENADEVDQTKSNEEQSRANEKQLARSDEKQLALQKATLEIQKKFGKNAIVKGTSLQEGATGLERGKQIGGHKA